MSSQAPRSLKSLYHRFVPQPVRYPIGRGRRWLADRCLRWVTPGPLPPRRLLTRVQETPEIREYLTVGSRAAKAVSKALEEAFPVDRGLRVLDFGCGLGRTLRNLETAGWELYGCDVDAETLGWSARAYPFVRFRVTSPQPPLPYPEQFFDAVYAVSVFTHFDADEQVAWAAELGRLLPPGGRALISTMGPRAFVNFPLLATDENLGRFRRDGYFLHVGGSSRPASQPARPGRDRPGRDRPGRDRPAFNQRGAFHTRAGIERFFGGVFELERWIEGGLDGFQDLAVMRRRTDPRVDTRCADRLASRSVRGPEWRNW